MIDKDKLFNLFGNPEENKDSKIILTVDEDFLGEPFAKLGMFTKLIVNHNVFHSKLSKFLKNEKANIDVAETKRASQYTVFNRAWFYISKLDLTNDHHIDALIDFKAEPFINSIDQAINYFSGEDVEEYEKCAKLLEIKKLKKEFENPLPI